LKRIENNPKVKWSATDGKYIFAVFGSDDEAWGWFDKQHGESIPPIDQVRRGRKRKNRKFKFKGRVPHASGKIAIDGGKPCPKCKQPMQRWEHPGGTGYYAWWDTCKRCSHVQHYPEARNRGSKRQKPSQAVQSGVGYHGTKSEIAALRSEVADLKKQMAALTGSTPASPDPAPWEEEAA
jgi:hypothetical protein